MGYALAEAALKAGAKVTLISGPVTLPVPANTDFISVETASQMFAAVIAKAETHDIYIGAAAVADYCPVIIEQTKIKKQATQNTLILQKTRDIVATVAQLTNRPFTVGFAAETHELEKYAKDKLLLKKLDMVAANWVGRDLGGFDSEQNALQIYWKDGQKNLAMTNKKQLAEQLISLIAKRMEEKKHEKNTA